jgi:TetR/AcrR family transcriptional regulator, transcriptional repressor for nem operon
MTMTKKAEATRQHILDTGRELVLRKGFVGVGLQEILSACGVPKGSFYHYFPSKEAFGCAMLRQYVDDYGQRLDGLLAEDGATGRDRLMRYWIAWIDDPGLSGGANRCLVVKLAAEVADLSDDLREVLNGGVQRLVQRIATLIDQGRDDGSIPQSVSPRPAAEALYQMWLGAALLAKLGRSRDPLLQALAATETLLG